MFKNVFVVFVGFERLLMAPKGEKKHGTRFLLRLPNTFKRPKVG